jgi:hypothetical protein
MAEILRQIIRGGGKENDERNYFPLTFSRRTKTVLILNVTCAADGLSSRIQISKHVFMVLLNRIAFRLHPPAAIFIEVNETHTS